MTHKYKQDLHGLLRATTKVSQGSSWVVRCLNTCFMWKRTPHNHPWCNSVQPAYWSKDLILLKWQGLVFKPDLDGIHKCQCTSYLSEMTTESRDHGATNKSQFIYSVIHFSPLPLPSAFVIDRYRLAMSNSEWLSVLKIRQDPAFIIILLASRF